MNDTPHIHASATVNKSHQRKRDDYTKDRFDWLEQVAADPQLPASDFKVAFVIATSLWRNKGTVTLMTPETAGSDQIREAWIGTREIADKIAMSRFTVMKSVTRLQERKHLDVTPGEQGRGRSNHYRLVKKGASTHLLQTVKGARSSLLDAAPVGRKSLRKGAPANLLGREKVHPRTSKGAPAHLIPSAPSDPPSEEERGAPQARPRRAPSSLKDSIAGESSADRSGVALSGPPSPDHLARAVARARVVHQRGEEIQ